MTVQELINSYKLEILKNHSKITTKNYLSDINHFINWFAKKYNYPFSPDLLSKTVIEEYKYSSRSPGEGGSAALSYKSFKRHLSSLRSFTDYLIFSRLLASSPFHEEIKKQINDNWKISLFKNYLYENGSSDLTIKYYVNDVRSFIKWAEKSGSLTPNSEVSNITASLFFEYVSRLKFSSGLSPRSINRKLSSLRRYLSFTKTQSFSQDYALVKNLEIKPRDSVKIEDLAVHNEGPTYSKIPPLRLVQRFMNLYSNLEEKAADLIAEKITSSNLKNIAAPSSRIQGIDKVVSQLGAERIKKELYAPYNISIASFPFHRKILYHAKYTRPEWYKRYHTYPFVHYLHLGILVIFAVGVSLFLYNNTLGEAGAQGYFKTQAKTFVFKGKLLDKNGNPVDSPTNIRLALYDSPTGSELNPIWKEVQTNIQPDPQGNVVLTVGSRNEIPESLLDQNQAIYLGLGIGEEEELTPRQQIGVPFANSAQNVQGLLPITSSSRQTNVLLALDASGELTIGGSANPVFQATGGDFTISGQTMILTTNASSDGSIILNPDGNGKIDILKPLTSSSGKVSVQGIFSITATSSAAPALSINQDGSGTLLTASTAGKTKFSIDNQGIVTSGEWAGTPIGTGFGGFGASITATGPGELLYSTSNLAYGHLAPGAAGECLVSDGRKAPLWSPCGFLTQLNGTLTLTNNTLDLILGSVSTGSAKFAFKNMSSGTPTFSVGGTLNISSDNLIEAINSELKIGGSSTKNVLLASAGGNVGVGTSSPGRTFDIKGNFGGNVDYYSDGSGTKTITRDTKALVYDLEKNTGTSDTSSTTTYNITGLPDIDGTIAYIYTKVLKGSTLSPQTQVLVLQINGLQLSSISTANVTSSQTTIKHYTAVRTNSTWHLLGSYGDSDTADIAEWIEVKGDIPESGSILSIADSGSVEKSKSDHDSKLAGIVSTSPNIVIGPQTPNSIRLALSGRVPAIVTSISGEIKEGDPITSSPFPGIGMKPDRNSATVGKALEDFMPSDSKCIEIDNSDYIPWPEDNGTNKLKPCFRIKIENLSENMRLASIDYGLTNVDYIYIGKIMVISNLSWSTTNELLASLESATISSDELPSLYALDPAFSSLINEITEVNPVVKKGNKTVKKISVFGGIVVGKIKTGSIIATNIAGKNMIAAKGVFEDLTSQSITAKKLITSPLAKLDQIKTDEISPLNSNQVVINIPESSTSALIVRNSDTEKEVAKIDSSGNVYAEGDLTARSASFSGSLSSNSLSSNNASISGTLRAQNLIADNISGLDDKVSTLAAQIIASRDTFENVPMSELSEYFSRNSVSAKFGTFHEGLLSLGASTFGSLSVMESLSIGTNFIFTNNSINTLGTDLSIQPLRQGAVSFLAGALRIESDGRLIVAEDAEFKKNLLVKGRLYANVISPLPDEDIGIELPSTNIHNSSFIIHDSSSSAVFSVNNKGDFLASGSASFAKINFNLVEQAYALDLNTATASSSAGTAVLRNNSSELTIINPLVTEKSLIYITPANNTNNNVLFLMRQNPENGEIEGTEGSFTVGVSQPILQDTLFNWLIVN